MFLNFFFVFVLSIASLCAHEDINSQQSDYLGTSPIVLQIISEQAESVQYDDSKNGKLYLKAEKIYPTNNQLWLYDDVTAILLPAVYMDQSGYYILCRKHGERPLQCPNCGRQWYYSENPTYYCRVCLIPGE